MLSSNGPADKSLKEEKKEEAVEDKKEEPLEEKNKESFEGLSGDP